jgi:peptidoglycan/LPS O-acetylase OafA/YrhL
VAGDAQVTRYVEGMDGLRALAALAIFAYHIEYLSGANQYGRFGTVTANLNIGVPVFFAISGFLLYRPFVAARRAGRVRPLRAYARGRVLRIVPGYWVALTLAALYPAVPGVFTGDWWRFYGFGQIYSLRTVFEGLGVAWSLCVEVTFYLALPLYALAVRRLAARRGGIPAELALLVALAAAGLFFQQRLQLFTIVATFVWFVPGMALAVVDVALRERRRAGLRLAWIPLGLAVSGYAAQCLLLSNPRYPTQPVSYAHQAAASVLSALVALALLTPICLPFERTGVALRALGSRPAAFLGRISYGIYLYHLVVLEAVFKLGLSDVVAGRATVSYVVVGVPATLALATASWYGVERPALSLKGRRRRVAQPARAAAEPAPSQGSFRWAPAGVLEQAFPHASSSRQNERSGEAPPTPGA